MDTDLKDCNQAAYYILPMLGRHPNNFPGFFDVAVGDDRRPEYDHHIHIIVHRDRLYQDNKYLFSLKTDPNFIAYLEDEDYEDYATLVFRIPPFWRLDYIRFVNGDYDEFSDDYKDRVEKIFPELGKLLKYVPKEGDVYH